MQARALLAQQFQQCVVSVSRPNNANCMSDLPFKNVNEDLSSKIVVRLR